MDTPNPSLNQVHSVVPLGNDRTLIFKRRNPSIRRYEAGATGSGQTQVFVEIVIIEACYGWFKDVAGRCRAARHTPTTILVKQRSLGLGTGEAKSTGEISAEPCSRVLLQISQSLPHVRVGKPFHCPIT
jgi:hypothetical protein